MTAAEDGPLRAATGSTMEVIVLGYDGCLGAGLIGAVDMLKLAWLTISKDQNREPISVSTASFDGQPIQDSSGRRLKVDGSVTADAASAVIVPGYLSDDGDRFLGAASIAAAAAWLRRQHALGALVCGSCSGVFLLGEAGLLDGRRCTTTWWRHDELRDRYPRADAQWGAPLLEDSRVVTAGGPLSWIDLCLHVIRALYGASAAKIAADFTVVDTVPSTQSTYVPPGHLAASDPFLLKAEHIIRQAGDAPLTVLGLARGLGTSVRTLHRHLERASGETPKRFIERVRFEAARTLLETTTHSVKRLAASAGYADEASFRRAFSRYSGMTPGAYRRWAQARKNSFRVT